MTIASPILDGDCYRILQALVAHRYRYQGEKDLQEAIALVLTGAGLTFEREVRLSPRDIIDFRLPGGIGLEVKIEGSFSAVARQLARYLQQDAISSLILVTTRLQLDRLPPALCGKLLITVALPRGLR